VRILVFGAGAMGSFLAALLCARHEVVAVARGDHVAAIRARGLHVSGLTERVARFTAVTEVPPQAPEIAFVTVKSYDTADAAAAMKHIRPPIVASMQNGLDNATKLERVAEDVVVVLTSHGVTYAGPGTVRHAGRGRTVVGLWRGREAAADLVARILGDVGLAVERTRDLRRELWLKAAVNAGINPLTAIHRVPNGRLLEVPEWDRDLREAAREVARVAATAGVDLPEDVAESRAVEVARETAGNRSSMLQDVERGRRTEVESITGAVLAQARAAGIAAPVIARLHGRILGLEESARDGSSRPKAL
jgi:2-dehydropantoate 2-reductase